MGTRTLRVTPEIVVNLCIEGPKRTVQATRNALPADVELVGIELLGPPAAPGSYVEGTANVLELTLRSETWAGDGGELESPVVESFALDFAAFVDEAGGAPC